ncbi:MAG: tyrosine-type recombinase/integrase, partial [Candidatus Acidiferrales bacterium]
HCPIWVDGFLAGQEIRRSLELKDWTRAQDLIRQWEADGRAASEPKPEPITINDACDKFIADAEARGLRESTLYKYRLLFRRLQEFATDNGIRYLCECDLDFLRRFRASWPNRNIAARKKLEAMRAFFRFCWESDWIPSNPAIKLKPPKITDPPTMPFSREEMIRILAACDQYRGGRGQCGRVNAQRLRALVQLLRFSGLRIRDAVTLSRERIVNGKLLLYTAKTGTPVHLPLPEFVIQELEMSRGTNPNFIFWSGEGKPKSCVGDWQRSLKKLFRLAEVPDGHAHRFRHTFATDLLLAGVPLDRVATLLGHTNSKITEKHYAPWIRARQEQLEADVRRVWDQIPETTLATQQGQPPFQSNTRIN